MSFYETVLVSRNLTINEINGINWNTLTLVLHGYAILSLVIEVLVKFNFYVKNLHGELCRGHAWTAGC